MLGYTSRDSQHIDKYMIVGNTRNGKKTPIRIKMPVFFQERRPETCMF